MGVAPMNSAALLRTGFDWSKSRSRPGHMAENEVTSDPHFVLAVMPPRVGFMGRG
jgi:hypothetical protein